MINTMTILKMINIIKIFLAPARWPVFAEKTATRLTIRVRRAML